MKNIFDSRYYINNKQIKDRPAFKFYTRIAKKYICEGRILDFGCGTGYFIKHLSDYFEVDGYEISEFAAKESQLLNPKSRIFTSIEEIEENVYDGIVSLHVLEHISDSNLINILKSWKKILKKNGKIMVVMPDKSGKGFILKKDKWVGFKDNTHINLKTGADWENFIKDNGFDIIKVGTDGLWDLPYNEKLPLIFNYMYIFKTVFQYIWGDLILKKGSGESVIIIGTVKKY